MKNTIRKSLLAALLLFGVVFCGSTVYAEGEEATETPKPIGASISLTPVSKVLQIASGSTYDASFKVKNESSDADMKIEVYAAPYSYVYSDTEDAYKLGFNKENNYTQISRWIRIKDTEGNYVEKPTFTIKPQEELAIEYRVTTPSSIPAGGQYAVIFAHTLTSVTSANGIKTEASPGMVIYGRSSEGETKIDSEISNMTIEQSIKDGEEVRNHFFGSAKVKNNGNVDFTAIGTLKVENIFGGVSYETPSNAGRVSIIPETELTVSDEWTETPSIGIFKVTWTVKAGEKTETIEKTIFLVPIYLILILILVLTFMVIWITMMVRKRKERRSRLAV